jgi:hypothetical protein
LSASENWRSTRAVNKGFALVVAISLKDNNERDVDNVRLVAKGSDTKILQEVFNESNKQDPDINTLYRVVNETNRSTIREELLERAKQTQNGPTFSELDYSTFL